MAAAENNTRPDILAQHHISCQHHHILWHHSPSGDEEWKEEELDPRIQTELEKLNRASEEINRLELELDDARAVFRQVLSDSMQCLGALARKLGTCVDRARPYYDALLNLKEVHLDSQKAVLRFERSCSLHEAAKEMVQLAEQGYKRREQNLDPTWQEMLNRATMKVNEAERERIESEEFHKKVTLIFKHKEEEVQKLQKDLRKVITKSKPYFEMKQKFNQVMKDHNISVSRLEADVSSAKALYSQALCSLEAISDDIHRQRLEPRQKLQLGIREAGVGAEDPSPHSAWAKGMTIEGYASPQVLHSDGDDDPIKASHRSENPEMVLDVNHIKEIRSENVACFEPAMGKKLTPKEQSYGDRNLKTDSLDVIFKTTLSDPQRASSSSEPSQNFQSTLVQLPAQSWPGSEVAHQELESSRRDSVLPGSSRQHNFEWSKSNLNCAHEQLNSSPMYDHQMSRNAPLSSLSTPSPPASDLSLMKTADRLKGLIMTDGNEMLPSLTQDRAASMFSQLHQQRVSPVDITAEASNWKHHDTVFNTKSAPPLLMTTSALKFTPSHDTVSIPKQNSSLPESPCKHTKSSKLQGLILLVDAANRTWPTQYSINQSGHLLSEKTPKVVISTRQPILGVFTEKPT